MIYLFDFFYQLYNKIIERNQRGNTFAMYVDKLWIYPLV